MEGFSTIHTRSEIMNESLVKYLSGLLDADGCLSLHFRDTGYAGNRTGRYTVALRLTLAAADTIDTKGFVASLPSLTGMGTIARNRNLDWWYVQKRADLEMLLPRVIKHMVIKAKHWQWLLDTWRNYRRGYGECLCDVAERERLSEESKKSRRANVGPIKPKNHPTWAWVAGYLDGDGCYHFRRQKNKAYGSRPEHESWRIMVSAAAHVDDSSVLDFLHKSFGGTICNQGPALKRWNRPLGKRDRSFAEGFLSNVVKHSRLKRNKIEAILHHTRQQRLNPQGAAA